MKIGKIYRIVHLHSNVQYVGSTFHKRLNDRMRNHRTSYNAWLKGKEGKCAIYPYFKEHGIENFKIILIKEYQVCDKKHLAFNLSDATTSEWVLGANGSSDYTFTGPGLTGAENDP